MSAERHVRNGLCCGAEVGNLLTHRQRVVRRDAKKLEAGEKNGCGAAPAGRAGCLYLSESHHNDGIDVAHLRGNVEFVVVVD